MALPFFYLSEPVAAETVQLDEPTSRHIAAVLRMEAGESLHLTDGKGWLYTAVINDAHKKRCIVRVTGKNFREKQGPIVTIGISLVKNVSRMEWFLEKSTELGVAAILPMICQRTEKQHFRVDRMQQILISAMLQSQQVWLPELSEPKPFKIVVEQARQSDRYIAHCMETERKSLRNSPATGPDRLLLIGPEGDFTPDEIAIALSNGFLPVLLGDTRLRTETAAMAGAVLLCVS